MDMELFQRRLAALIEEFGGRLETSPQIRLREHRKEHFITAGGASVPDGCMAVREVQPFVIDMIIEAESIGAWHHVSGDDRRLHPDLKKG